MKRLTQMFFLVALLVIMSSSISQAIEFGLVDFTYTDYISESHNLTWRGNPAGRMDTTIKVEWTETWEVDPFGNKLNLVYCTDYTIINNGSYYIQMNLGYRWIPSKETTTSTYYEVQGFTENTVLGATESEIVIHRAN